jgi:hypothetical protein
LLNVALGEMEAAEAAGHALANAHRTLYVRLEVAARARGALRSARRRPVQPRYWGGLDVGLANPRGDALALYNGAVDRQKLSPAWCAWPG